MIIHSYTAAEPGLFVNGYLLETTDGVILVDSTLLMDDAYALGARHTPLLAAFVTHAHPDHFNGRPSAVPEDVPVYASARVAGTIERIAVPKREQWQPVYGDQWPDTYRVPEQLAGSVQVADVEVEIRAISRTSRDA
jgi:glyoxylase-like metal-dependent hydrolase (beta-lactamase superfamily II)